MKRIITAVLAAAALLLSAAALKDAIDEAQNVSDDDGAAQNEVDNSVDALSEAVTAAGEAVQLAQDKATFAAEKEAMKSAADAMAQDSDSQACREIIHAAKNTLDMLAYDETKPLSDNMQALDEILEQLAADLKKQRYRDAHSGEDYLIAIVTQTPYSPLWNYTDDFGDLFWNLP